MKKALGFTLVELLVVIAIIGILVGMVLPAVQSVRESARLATCQNNVRQIVIAAQNYEGAAKGFPAGWSASVSPAENGWGWMTALLHIR